jgi:hypothetical protein
MALHPPIKTSILEASKVSGFCYCDGPIKITHCTHPQTKKKKKMDYLTPPADEFKHEYHTTIDEQ